MSLVRIFRRTHPPAPSLPEEKGRIKKLSYPFLKKKYDVCRGGALLHPFKANNDKDRALFHI
ncbi:MAG: hypothetical protein Q8920_12735 [Bacillota bacterium]|nr:hypothetical protein [Bacillota bacterium]